MMPHPVRNWSRFVLIVAVLACAPARAYTGKPVDARAQAEAAEIVQSTMWFYWHGGDIEQMQRTLFKGITVQGRMDVVEQGLRRASSLVPDRLDLRFGIASSQVSRGRIQEALATYAEIEAMDPRGFEAAILQAAYQRAIGEDASADARLKQLTEQHPERTRAYVRKFSRLEELLGLQIHTTPVAGLPEENHAILVLGFALANDGTMRPPLSKRLEATLKIAQMYPKAKLVLSGGVQRKGVTEAHVMSEWLQARGVSKDRLELEDQSRDTVGNAIHAVEVIKRIGARHVTLVTSASHIRRAMVLLQEAGANAGLQVTYGNLVELDLPTMEKALVISRNERIAIYRDMMRTSGIWMYPGIQR